MNMHLQDGVAAGARPNAGIDVSKQRLDPCLGNEARRVANDARGRDELTATMPAAAVDLVVMVEATGGYESGLDAELAVANAKRLARTRLR